MLKIKFAKRNKNIVRIMTGPMIVTVLSAILIHRLFVFSAIFWMSPVEICPLYSLDRLPVLPMMTDVNKYIVFFYLTPDSLNHAN